MVVDQLNRLEEIGMLKELISVGIIAPEYYTYREIYLKFYHLTKVQNPPMKKMQAYSMMEEQFGYCDKTIREACRKMKYEF